MNRIDCYAGNRYNNIMRSLFQTNRYAQDKLALMRWLEENARESSVFEGAHRLPPPKRQRRFRKRRLTASTKTLVKAS